MFCKNCGQTIEDGHKFCKSCGQEIKLGGWEVANLKKTKSSGWKKILAIIIGVLLVLYIIGYFSSQSENKPEEVIPPEIIEEKKIDLASIVNEWKPIIGYLECDFRYSDTGIVFDTVAGSGVFFYFVDGSYSVMTNKHILVDEETGYGVNNCSVVFPGDNKIYEIVNTFTDNGSIVASPTDDWGQLTIYYPSEHMKTLTNTNTFPLCPRKASVGDEVVILGYPGIGSQTDITATKGIISGYDGDYYITDAKIETGNSGGAAILIKDDCYLGIPSYIILGEAESLSRILDKKVMWGF